ncbi:MAG: efflux RND transporter periplasmic adaptor subunit [Phycisphaerales bacterium]|nr:efflux RND transporter periplasmic adaptor subunit [Phycisphaerales bacterium]
MKKRLLLLTLVLITITALAIYYAATRPTKSITLTGIVTTDSVIANAQIQGRLDRLYVQQGDIVKANQLLATIQPAQWQADMSFYENSQRQAETQVSQAAANLAAATAQVKEAESDLERDRLTFEREAIAFKEKVESPQAYDQARTAYDAQKAHVETLRKQEAAAKAAVEATTHQLAAAAAQKDKAKVQLAYTEIRSPVDAIVDVRASMQGEVVNPGQAIVTLINPDDLWVRADVEETYIDQIRLGDKLQVKLPSGRTRTGTVFYRAVDADFATQRDVSRTKRDIKTFEIRLRCDNSDRALAVGMTAYVTLPLHD